eukprot:403478-Prorocentrum_minimum.AAC.1
MPAPKQRSRLYELSTKQYVDILKSSSKQAATAIRRLKVANLTLTLDTLLALRELSKRSLSELETNERLAFVLGLRAFGHPAPEPGDDDIDTKFAKSVFKKIDSKLNNIKKKCSKLQLTM